MRKIEEQVLEVLGKNEVNVKTFGNTCVAKLSANGWGMLDDWKVSLHGHEIAKRENGVLYLRHAGWVTATTASRLHALSKATGYLVGRKLGVMAATRYYASTGVCGASYEIEAEWTRLPD